MIRKRQRRMNREYRLVSGLFVFIFLSLIAYVVYFDATQSEEFINSPYNTRQETFAQRVIRGDIVSSDGETLAYTKVHDDGYEERIYPYSNMFAHVVGYDSHDKSGIESKANFHLLSSHSFFLNQLEKEFRGEKNMGDTVVSTLDYQVQKAAYDALGNRYGAVIAIEPATGKIIAMVSKPDFDPNSIAWEYKDYINDSGKSNLLNRVTDGHYPPGSIFKIVTALDYLRSNGFFDGYNYNCQGSVTVDEHSIRCYGGTVHGGEDLTTAFAKSCNAAFATMGIDMGAKSLRDTAESLLFNKKLPYSMAAASSFSLKKGDDRPLIMQTAIGQGNTLVSPLHMAMITAAIANNGVLMEPYLIDSVVNDEGYRISKNKPDVYGRLMTSGEATALAGLMRGVVTNGTASALYAKPYTSAGKTGSAEFNSAGESHSWFVGYCNVDDPDLVVAVIVEGGGTGSEAAVPIAGKVFDAYYNSHAAEVADDNTVDYSDYENGSDHESNGWFEIFEEYEEVFPSFGMNSGNQGSGDSGLDNIWNQDNGETDPDNGWNPGWSGGEDNTDQTYEDTPYEPPSYDEEDWEYFYQDEESESYSYDSDEE